MHKKHQPYIFLLASSFFYSTLDLFAVILTRLNIVPFNQILWRSIFGTVTSLILFKVIFKINLSIKRTELPYIYINSLLMLGGFITFILSIYLGTPIAKAVALIYSYPISIIILSYLFFKDIPTLKQLIALGLSLISVTFILELWKIKNLTNITPGELMALINSVFYSLMIIYGKLLKKRIHMHPVKTTAYSLVFLIPQLILIGSIFSYFGLTILQPIITLDFSLYGWLALLGIGFFGTTLSFGFLYAGVSHVQSTVAGLLLITELVWATIWGVFLFNQPLTFWMIAGIIGVIISVLLI